MTILVAFKKFIKVLVNYFVYSLGQRQLGLNLNRTKSIVILQQFSYW